MLVGGGVGGKVSVGVGATLVAVGVAVAGGPRVPIAVSGGNDGSVGVGEPGITVSGGPWVGTVVAIGGMVGNPWVALAVGCEPVVGTGLLGGTRVGPVSLVGAGTSVGSVLTSGMGVADGSALVACGEGTGSLVGTGMVVANGGEATGIVGGLVGTLVGCT